MNHNYDRNVVRKQRRRQLRIGVLVGVAAAAIGVQFSIHLACLDLEDEQKTGWSLEETNAFIDYLYENRSQAGDGGNFKTATFTAAAEAILPLLKNGPKKTRQICREKWSSLKFIHSSIRNCQATSERLCNSVDRCIKPTGEESVGNDCISQGSNNMKDFQNWLYYDQVQAILFNAGNHAFSTFDPTQQPVIDRDIEETGDSSSNVSSGGGGSQMNVDSDEATSMGSAAVSGNKRKFSALSTSDDLSTARPKKTTRLIDVSTASTRKRSSKSSASSLITSSATETDHQQSKLIAIYGLQASIDRLVDTVIGALERESHSSSIERAEGHAGDQASTTK